MKQRSRPFDPTSVNIRAVLDKWVARSRWWSNDERRVYARLHTSRGIVEVYRSGQQWFMSRIAD
jgi:hypothetical protein